MARPAGHMMRHNNTVAFFEPFHARTECRNRADNFMAEHLAGPNCVVGEFEQVRAAEAEHAMALPFFSVVDGQRLTFSGTTAP